MSTAPPQEVILSPFKIYPTLEHEQWSRYRGVARADNEPDATAVVQLHGSCAETVTQGPPARADPPRAGLEPPQRFELWTCALRMHCSTTELGWLPSAPDAAR